MNSSRRQGSHRAADVSDLAGTLEAASTMARYAVRGGQSRTGQVLMLILMLELVLEEVRVVTLTRAKDWVAMTGGGLYRRTHGIELVPVLVHCRRNA